MLLSRVGVDVVEWPQDWWLLSLKGERTIGDIGETAFVVSSARLHSLFSLPSFNFSSWSSIFIRVFQMEYIISNSIIPAHLNPLAIIKRFPKNVDVYSENPLVLSHTWTSSIVVTIFRKNIVQTRCKSSPSGYFETNDVRSRTLKCQIAMSQNMRFGYLAPWLAEFPPRDHNWWCHAHALARSATRHKQDKRIWSSVKIWYMVDKN